MSCKKLIFIFLFSSYLFLVSSYTPVHAQSPTPASTNIVQDAVNGLSIKVFKTVQSAAELGQTTVERWAEDFMVATGMTVLRAFIGPVPDQFFTDYAKLASGEIKTMPKIYPSGAIGKGNEMIAVLFTPQASGIEYIASVKDELLGKPAYAQGVGFKGLEFLLPLWKAARNIVYVLSSIIFVVIGLMIILRVKISPQAVVTIQSAIPQVITTLILVTFSYAIAGLMIDLGNLIAGIVVALLFNTQGVNLNDNLLKGSSFGSSSGLPVLSDIGNLAMEIVNAIAKIKIFNFTNLVNPDFLTFNSLTFLAAPHWSSLMLLGGLLGGIITGTLLGSFGNIFGGSLGQVILSGGGMVTGSVGGGLIGMIIIPIILCIVVGIWLMKLYFGLIKVYVTIIFKIITGPLEIAMGAFPNSKTGFGTWLLDIFANIMVFPITTIFLIVLSLITDSMYNGKLNTVWVPSVLGSGSSSFIFGQILAACVGLAGLALISKLPDMIPQYIFMIKPSPFGQAIGQNMYESIGKPAIQAKDAVVGTAATYGGTEVYRRNASNPAAQAAARFATKFFGGNIP